MSHYCNQNLYIVAACDDDAVDLLKLMAENQKLVTEVDPLAGISPSAGWKSLAKAVANETEARGVAFFSGEPDVSPLSGTLSSWEAFGKPCFRIELNVKWGPSGLPGMFCSSLDTGRYGWASIDGGEYILATCEDGEEGFVSLHYGSPDDRRVDDLDREEYLEWGERIVFGEAPEALNDLALHQLFSFEGVYLYFRDDEGDHEDDDNLEHAAEKFGREDTDENRFSWKIENGALSIYAEGERDVIGGYRMPLANPPWLQFYDEIAEVEFSEGLLAKSLSYLLASCINLKKIVGLDRLITSELINTDHMFWGCESLKSIDLSNLDLSGVSSMDSMFRGCCNLESINLSNLDLSGVSSMDHMFSGCESLESIDLSSLDLSNVACVNGMFRCCTGLESVDLSGVRLPRGVRMLRMFEKCESLKSIDLSALSVPRVGNATLMFYDCKSLESADLSGFPLPSGKGIKHIFRHCASLKSLTVSRDVDWRFSGLSSKQRSEIIRIVE